MEAVWNALKNINYSGIPVAKIVAVIVILTLTQALRRLFIAVIIKSVEHLTGKTKSTLDDELVAVIKPSLGWLIFIGGVWLSKTILADILGPQLNEAIGKTLNFIVIFIVAYVVYRASSILGQIIAN